MMDVLGSLRVQHSARMEALCLLIGEMLYAYYFVLLWKNVSSRLLALLVLLPPILLVPWRAPTGVERVLYSFIFIWIIGTKLLLLAWNRGAANDPVALSSFPRFFTAMVLSFHVICEHTSTSVLSPAATTSFRDSALLSVEKSAVRTSTRRKLATAGASEPEEETVEHKISDGLEGEVRSSGGKDVCLTWLRHSCLGALVNSRKGEMVLLRALVYFMAFASIVRLLLAQKPILPLSVLVLLYAFLMYFMLLVIFEGAAGVPAMILGIQLPSQFDMPYLATSLGDFWGRRWNRLVNNLLRASVYEPIIQLERRQRKKRCKDVTKLKPSNGARAVGIFASFLVSGLMHELFFFYLMKTTPRWETTAFFVVNGIGTMVEVMVMKSGIWPPSLTLPKVLRWAYTIGFVHATGMWLFFAPLERLGMMDASLADLGRFIDWVEKPIVLSVSGRT